MKKIGLILLSGGLDSTTMVIYVIKAGYEVFGLTINYGQRNKIELRYAQKVAEILNINHQVVDFSDYKNVGVYSLLTQSDKSDFIKDLSEKITSQNVPITYVPMRNTFFIILASALLESKVLHMIEQEGVDPKEIDVSIFLGTNALDYTGYPDCRGEYFEAMKSLLTIASKIGTTYDLEIKLKTPFLNKKKEEIIELALSLGTPLEWTWSCYENEEIPCGVCEACRLRDEGFKRNGISDPLLIRLGSR